MLQICPKCFNGPFNNVTRFMLIEIRWHHLDAAADQKSMTQRFFLYSICTKVCIPLHFVWKHLTGTPLICD